MKRTLLYIGSGLLILIIGLFLTAILRPDAWRIERSMSTTATAADVYSVLGDLHRFNEWSPWAQLDPNVKTAFSGASSGPGSVYSWDGDDKVGAGRMTMKRLVPDQEVEVLLEFLRPFASTSTTTWTIEDEGSQRRVRWTMEGTYDSLMPKLFGLFMDRIVGKDFDKGLAALKGLVEHS